MEQHQLPFDDKALPARTPVCLDEVAATIAANAGHVDYPDRTSEAACDQGWGPVVLPERPEPIAFTRPKQRPRNYAGKIRGDSEADGGLTPAGHETHVPLTEAEKHVGRVALALARKALESKNNRS